jgi:signal transduction histidine kinase
MGVSLVEQGRFTFQKVDSEVLPLVRTAMSDMKARGVDNEITARVADNAGWSLVDPEKFVQLLVILLDNAVKFSPPTSPIEIEVEPRGDETVVSVMDRGIGVSAESRELIFDRFYQVEDVQHHSSVGLGLGLYLALEIVQAHNGQIHHEPREGGGSIFQFSIRAEPSQ